MKHILLYPILICGYILVLFLARMGCLNSSESLGLLEIIYFFELCIFMHFVYIVLFLKPNKIKLLGVFMVLITLVLIFSTIHALNPF